MRGIRGESFDGLRIRKTSGGAASQLEWRYAKHPCPRFHPERIGAFCHISFANRLGTIRASWEF
jgi:hypothetical protein